MVPKGAVVLCLISLILVASVDAQRDGRRRTGGRRRPSTESPPPEEPELEEELSHKSDVEPEALPTPKAPSATQSEPETSSASSEKDGNQGLGPQFLVPRGTRKPRPAVRERGEGRPRPTLPAFIRGGAARSPRPDKTSQRLGTSSVSSFSITSTAKPARGTNRRRGSTSPPPLPAVADDDSVTEAAAKKRFGGATRRPSRGGRRSTTEAPFS